MRSVTVRINPWLAIASVCFLASTGASAASLHVTAGDALSNKAYDLQFNPPGGTATALPGFVPLPANPKSSVRSLVYVANETTAKADLIAADNRTSKIVRYAGATGSSITMWSGTGTGPSSPIGLSADSFGNVFVGRGDQGHPELWVLKNNGDGTFSVPKLIDKTSFGPTGSLGSIRFMDSLVVRTSIAGGLSAGDLLVLLSDGRVLRYSALAISNFILHGTPVGTATTLIAATTFTNGHVPTSIAIWPKDGSLLIPTVDGAVRRYNLTPTGSTQIANFATGLGSESTGVGQLLGLIRTFASSAGTFAVIDNPQKNKIYELIAPEDRNPPLINGCPNIAVVCNPPKATITTVANPVGLAVTDSSAASTDCVNSGNSPGCSLLGGTITVGTISTINPPGNGSVVVVACTVEDPRASGLGCDGSELFVDSVCPGYPANTKVPAYMCGASGASGHAMALLKFDEASGYPTAPFDLQVNVELAGDALLGPGEPICSQRAFGWTPLVGEGLIPESNAPGGPAYLTELASHCGSTKGLAPGHSLMLVGAQIDPNLSTAAVVALTNPKYDALSSTITAASNMTAADRTALGNAVTHAKDLFSAPSLTTANRYSCSAHQAYVSDQTVVSTQFSGNPNKLSALSAIKGRLENLVMHIQNRIIAPGSPPAWNDLNNPPQADPLPEDSTTVAMCDIAAPSAPGTPAATEVSSDGSSTTYNVSWTASSDITGTPAPGNPNENNAAKPGPYASGIHWYHVYLGPTEVTGSPTTALTLPITINDTAPTSHPVTITADDNATGGTGPVFNTSTAAATSAQCTDQVNNGDLTPTPDGVCDVVVAIL